VDDAAAGAVVLDGGLVYLRGGGTWQNSTHSASLPFIPAVGTIASREITHFGWTVGLGTEWMISPNWMAFIEYNYYDFDDKNYNFSIISPFA